MNDAPSTFPPPSAWPPPALGSPRAAPDRAAPPREPGLDRSDVVPAPMPGRPLWLIAGTILMLSTMFWGCFQIVSVLAREQWTSTYTQPAAGITALRVDNDNGRVTIRGADTDEITVHAEVSRGLFAIEETAAVDGDRFVVSADCPPLGNEWCSVDYEIVVPRDLAVDVDAANGRITVTGIDGSIDVSSDNGRVELDGVAGPVIASSDNGRVVGTDLRSATVEAGSDNGRVELTFTAAPDTVVASSDNGRVDIAVPPVEGDYAVDARSSNGSESVEITSDPASSRTISAHSDNGSVTVRYLG